MSLNDESAVAAAIPPEEIAPDTGRRLTTAEKLRFGIGFALFSLLWMTAGTSGSGVLLPQRFDELNIGTPEVILGAMNSVGCIFALFANIIFGALSDITRSRFGKRTPWIVAVLSDRIPENVRGTFSSFYGGAMIVGQSAGTFLGSKFIDTMGVGFVIGAVLFAITGILTIIIWPAERSSKVGSAADDTKANVKLSPAAIAKSFIPPTKNCRDFYLALVGRLLLIFGWSMISGYQLYILKKYCGLSVDDAASTLATMSLISMVVLMICSVVSGPISDKLHKRKIIVAIGSVIIAVGVAIPFFMPTALGMMLYAGIGGVGYGIYIAVDQALNVDVLPSADEAGKDLGILNLANTVGQVLAPVATGAIVVATGSYAQIFPVAIVSVLIGAVVIMLIKKVA
ncbi:MFS transporter [Bifidobacterium dentium]|uniref:MFS transporter n=1 Tax=Bifidobacterium dentium TaxID=1689 RepID=UPI00080B5056|nr:MFS transporter [Bifidobacterium dentium]